MNKTKTLVFRDCGSIVIMHVKMCKALFDTHMRWFTLKWFMENEHYVLFINGGFAVKVKWLDDKTNNVYSFAVK